MTVEASNILSLLSNSPLTAGLGNSAPAASPAGLDFAAQLFQQLSAMQAQLTNANGDLASNFSNLQDTSNSQTGGFSQQSMQNFAALFGNYLPTDQQGLDGSINLDDTLTTLSEVMQSLQQLQSGPASNEPLPAPILQTPEEEPKPVTTATAPDATTIALMSLPPSNAVPLPVVENTPAVLVNDQDASEALEALANAGQLPRVETNKQPNKTPFANQQSGIHQQSKTPDSADSVNQLPIQNQNSNEHSTDHSQQQATTDAFKAWDAELSNAREAHHDPIGTQSEKNFAALNQNLQQLNQAVSTQQASKPAPLQPAMQQYFGDPKWNQELGDQLIWMHKQDMPSAELRLNPEHLGPVLVKINMQNDQANITFTTQHLAVKEALEAAIPKLREMMNGQQLNLADVNVSQQHSEQQQQPKQFFQMASEQERQRQAQDAQHAENGESSTANNEILDEIETGRAVSSNGLLSLFA